MILQAPHYAIWSSEHNRKLTSAGSKLGFGGLFANFGQIVGKNRQQRPTKLKQFNQFDLPRQDIDSTIATWVLLPQLDLQSPPTKA